MLTRPEKSDVALSLLDYHKLVEYVGEVQWNLGILTLKNDGLPLIYFLKGVKDFIKSLTLSQTGQFALEVLGEDIMYALVLKSTVVFSFLPLEDASNYHYNNVLGGGLTSELVNVSTKFASDTRNLLAQLSLREDLLDEQIRKYIVSSDQS